MRKINLLAVSFAIATALFSCNNSSTKEEVNKKSTDSSTTIVVDKPTVDSANMPKMLTARFIEFSQGDASHYIFKDSDDKTWDFGRDEDSTVKFAIELPKSKANDSNQGWSSNKALQNVFFTITYAYSNEPQYEGGPMAKVAVIKKVEASKAIHNP